MLLELFDASENLVYSKTIDLYQSGTNIIDVNVLDVSWLDGATTLNRTGQDSGTYTLNYLDALGCSLSSPINIGSTNSTPLTPTIGTTTHLDCVNSTGSIVLSGLPVSGTIYQTGSVVTSYAVTGATMTISGLAAGTYNFSVSNGSCSSSSTGDVTINPAVINKWNGTAWSLNEPTMDQSIEFSGSYNKDVNLEGCSCEVKSGNVTIVSGRTMTLTNEINIAGGTIKFQNNSNLVQINDVSNTGNINYQRETVTDVDKFDYTYWASPVSAQTLYKISPNTLWDKYFSYDAVNNNWIQENSLKIMDSGIGHIIRGPQNHYAPNPIGTYRANFIGVPNNGTIPVTITATREASYLLGNPYPSALDADVFFI